MPRIIITRRQREKLATEIANHYNKSERQMNASGLGQFLDFEKVAAAEDAGINTRRVSDPMKQHAWVNIAVDFRARNLARCDYKIYDGEDEVTSGPTFDLFNEVNPSMSQYQLWEATESWRMIRGEAIWVYTGKDQRKLGANELPVEIYVSDPQMWKVVLNERQTSVLRWMWFPDPVKQEGIPFSNREIVHFMMWNKWDRWRGENYWLAQTEAIEQDVESDISNTQLIKNKSIPPGILSSEQILTDDSAKAMAARWEKNHKGSAKTGKIGVIGHGAKYQPIAMSHSDMQYMEMKKWNRIEVLSKAGIPPVLVSVKDESTPMSGTDTKEQQVIFWTNTMFPEKRSLEDKLRTDYFKRFDLPYRGEFSTESISELQEDFGKKVEKATKLFTMGIPLNAINEKLEMGFEEYDWGEAGYRSAALKRMTAEEELPGPTPMPFMALSDNKTPSWTVGFEVESGRRWDALMAKYESRIKRWFFAQRKYFLDRYGKSLKQKAYEEFEYWVAQELLIAEFSEAFFKVAINEVGKDLVTIFRSTGFNSEFDIFSVNVDSVINARLDNLKGLVDTTKNAIDTTIREGLQEGITTDQMAARLKDKYVKLGNHAETIARTETETLKAEAKKEAFEREQVQQIMWLHLGGGQTDRPDHVAIDGMVRLFEQEMFPTDAGGILYPHAPGGSAADVINCYCDYIPVAQEV